MYKPRVVFRQPGRIGSPDLTREHALSTHYDDSRSGMVGELDHTVPSDGADRAAAGDGRTAGAEGNRRGGKESA